MIDSIRAEIDYRQEQVRRDVAGSRGTGRASKGQAERRAAPARPAVLRAVPQADGRVC